MNKSSNKSPVILVTGGSRGIGKAVVDYFKDQQWQVAACTTSEKGLENSRADLHSVCDVSQVEQVKSFIQQVVKKYQHIDLLVNNAGISGSDSFAPEASDEPWHKIIEVNLYGTYYMSKYALPYIKNHQGRIINISSVLGLRGVPDQSAYCASKHAVEGFTKSLALTIAPRGITVNSICPGWVDTDMAQQRFQELKVTQEKIEKATPLQKIVTAKEVAALVFYLASPEAAHITGQSLVIDSGGSL